MEIGSHRIVFYLDEFLVVSASVKFTLYREELTSFLFFFFKLIVIVPPFKRSKLFIVD